MAIVPSPATAAPGQKITANFWNTQVKNDLNFILSGKPVCQLMQTTAQSITNGTPTAISFGSAGDEVVDSDGQHDTATNPSRVNIGKTLGLYRISGAVAYTSNSSGTYRRAYISFNGTQLPAGFGAGLQPNATFYTVNAGPFIVRATAATDYVELMALHDATAAVNTGVTGGLKSHFLVEWLGA